MLLVLGQYYRCIGAATVALKYKPILESVQLRKHCISKAERHRARRYGLFGFVWFENIVSDVLRNAKCACQPPRGFRVNGK